MGIEPTAPGVSLEPYGFEGRASHQTRIASQEARRRRRVYRGARGGAGLYWAIHSHGTLRRSLPYTVLEGVRPPPSGRLCRARWSWSAGRAQKALIDTAGDDNSVSASRVTKLRMASAREAIAPTVERVLEVVADAALSENQQHDLSVALSEALANAAIHGNGLQPRQDVVIHVEVEPASHVAIIVSDNGTGFDVKSVADPTQADGLMQPRGRGVFLMKQLVDKLHFNGIGNQVRLIVECRRDEPHE